MENEDAAMHHIVVGTDFSEPSSVAVRAAAQLAKRLDTRLTVVHSYDPIPIGLGSVPPAPFWPALDVTEGREKYADTEFKKLAAGDLADTPHDTALLSHASSSSALCNYAAKVGAELLVVGTHGRTGLERMLIGSVAEQAVRHAPCAVLAVRPGGDQAVFPQHMLVCTDLSSAAEPALDLTRRLAHTLGARVTVLNAQDQSVWRNASDSADIRTLDALESQLNESLEQIHHERFAPPVSKVVLIRKSIPQAIVQHAQHVDADLIVLATHGRTGIARLLLGSVAERVTRHAHCSVLVARSRGVSFLSQAV